MNRIRERYVAQGRWVADSALHTGGEAGLLESADMVLLRDHEGRFLIPGASIAGAARNWLARQTLTRALYEQGLEGEAPALRALFGGGHKDTKNDFAGLLTVHDARIEGHASVRLRDGVAIEPSSGIAGDGAKYNLEALPRNSAFEFRLSLALFDELPEGLTPGDLLPFFRLMLDGFFKGNIRLGAKTRRGFGRGKIEEWQVFRLDMSRLDHVKAWLARDLLSIDPEPREWLQGDLPEHPVDDSKSLLTIDAHLRLKTSLLVRAAADASVDAKQPDSVHLTEAGSAILPGTGIGGALRGRCERIANLFGIAGIVSEMFGLVNKSNPLENRASKVWVSESRVWNGEPLVQGRVSIDRFTGAAKDAALFEEAAFWPYQGEHHTRVQISLDNPTPAEAGLLALAFKDLWLGDLPLGGGVGSGRGVFAGQRALVTYQRGTETSTVSWVSDEADPATMRIESGDPAFLNRAVECLRERRTPNA